MNEKLAKQVRAIVAEHRLVEPGARHTLKAAWRRVLAGMDHRQRGAFRRLMGRDGMRAAAYVMERDTAVRVGAA